MALRSIDLFTVPGQADPAVTATYAALESMPSNWKRITVPGSVPFPGLHPRSKTPCVKRPSLLTNTSKMPCPSWGLPAGKACPGAKYGEGSICGSCYAAKGNYGVPMVQHALSERFKWTLALMRTPAGQDAFVAYMVKAIEIAAAPVPARVVRTVTASGIGWEIREPARSGGYFRVHDSGDLFSPAYARCWSRIARQLSHVRFWFPTRSYRIANILPAIQELAALPNVTVRPSALMLDADAPVIDGLAAGSGATYSKDDATCPAYRQDGECRDCRSCWDRPTVPVLYPLH